MHPQKLPPEVANHFRATLGLSYTNETLEGCFKGEGYGSVRCQPKNVPRLEAWQTLSFAHPWSCTVSNKRGETLNELI